MRWLSCLLLGAFAMGAQANAPSLSDLNCGSVAECVSEGMTHFNDQEYAKSRPYFEAACAEKEPVGCQNIAVIYMRGLGQQKNPEQAFVYFENACRYGKAEVCKIIGLDHYRGTTFTKNYPKALEMFQAGCPKNEPASCYLGGMLMVDKTLGLTNPAMGVQFLEKGCELGEGGACEGLGRVLYTGQGVPQDQDKGKASFKKGCDLQHQVSCDLLKQVSAPPKAQRSFNLTVGSLSADGLEVRDLKCDLTQTHLTSSMLVIGGLAKQKDALNACANGQPQSPRVSMTFTAVAEPSPGRVRNVRVSGVSDAVSHCVQRAVSQVEIAMDGYCEVTLQIGH